MKLGMKVYFHEKIRTPKKHGHFLHRRLRKGPLKNSKNGENDFFHTTIFLMSSKHIDKPKVPLDRESMGLQKMHRHLPHMDPLSAPKTCSKYKMLNISKVWSKNLSIFFYQKIAQIVLYKKPI